MQQCESLEYLDVSNNALEVIPRTMGDLKELRVLRLTNNSIKIFPSVRHLSPIVQQRRFNA